jgi:hypothetical protein
MQIPRKRQREANNSYLFIVRRLFPYRNDSTWEQIPFAFLTEWFFGTGTIAFSKSPKNAIKSIFAMAQNLRCFLFLILAKLDKILTILSKDFTGIQLLPYNLDMRGK